jgi:hypothetical protein
VSGNRVLRKILRVEGSNKGMEKLRNEELLKLHSSRNIIGIIVKEYLIGRSCSIHDRKGELR